MNSITKMRRRLLIASLMMISKLGSSAPLRKIDKDRPSIEGVNKEKEALSEVLPNHASLRAYSGNSFQVFVLINGIRRDFSIDVSDHVSADNGGTIVVDKLDRRWKHTPSGAVSLTLFGAIDGGNYGENSPLKRALLYGVSSGIPVDIDVNISIGETIAIEGGRVALIGRKTITQTISQLLVLNDVEYFRVGSGVSFNSSLTAVATPSICVRGKSVLTVEFDGTVGNCLLVLRGDGKSGSRCKKAQIAAKFIGNYSGAAGNDVSNVLDVRQYDLVDFSNSSFSVVGPERFIKTADVGTLRASDFSMSGSCQKQVIDCYHNTKNIFLERYTVTVSNCTAFLEQKQANMAPSFPQRLYLGKGSVSISSSQASVSLILFQGAWGLLNEPRNYKCSVELSGVQAVVNAPNSTAPLISVRGVTDYQDKDCSFQQIFGPLISSSSVSIRNTKNIASESADVIGHFEFSDTSKTTDGVAYLKSTESVAIKNPRIRDYNANGGIFIIVAKSLTRFSVEGGSIESGPGRKNVLRSVYSNNSNIKDLSIKGVAEVSGSGAAGFAERNSKVTNNSLNGSR